MAWGAIAVRDGRRGAGAAAAVVVCGWGAVALAQQIALPALPPLGAGKPVADSGSKLTLVQQPSASAQKQPGSNAPPPRLAFTLSSTLSHDSNSNLSVAAPDPGTTLDTKLGFALDTQTDVERLQLTGSGLLRLGNGGTGSRSGAQQPDLHFAYLRDTGNTRVSAAAGYIQSDVNLLEPFSLPDGTTGTLPATGTVTNSTLGLSLETGINDPLGFILSGSVRNVSYSDTSNPNVYDSRLRAASLTTRMTLSPRSTVDLTFGFNTEVDLNATDTRRAGRSVGVALSQGLSPALTLQTEIGYASNRTDQTIFATPFSQTSAGLFGLVGLTAQMANGTASTSLQSDRDSIGSINALHFGRQFSLINGGRFAADVGVQARPGHAAQPVGSLIFSPKLATDSFTVSLSRSISLNANNVDVAYTRLGLQYGHPINTVASLGLGVSVGRVGGAGDGAVAGQTLTTLRATYSYKLTQDWNLDTGYQYRHATNQATGPATSNMLFVTIGRKFVAWP